MQWAEAELSLRSDMGLTATPPRGSASNATGEGIPRHLWLGHPLRWLS